VDLLVQDRAVEPDNMLDVVFDFGGVGVVQRRVVWGEVAVRDDVIVAGRRFVDVLWRQR